MSRSLTDEQASGNRRDWLRCGGEFSLAARPERQETPRGVIEALVVLADDPPSMDATARGWRALQARTREPHVSASFESAIAPALVRGDACRQ